jgi:hypothetical protein
MADLQTTDNVETPAGVLYYPQSADIDSIDLITVAGQRIELKKMMIELSYFEDIYSFAVSGHVIIGDALGIVDKFQLVGNEYIEINFGRVKGSNLNVNKTFRVYKLGKRVPAGNINSEVLTLHFCSEELILSEQIKVGGSYNGKGDGQEISKTVTHILQNDLKIKKPLHIENTKGIYNFVVPRLKPFEAISWLSLYARPASQSLAGADMVMFENKNGFHFKSLRSLFAQQPYKTFKYQQNNLESTMEDKYSSVIDYEFVKSYDVLNEISSGMFANRLISVDPLTRSYKITDFDYKIYSKDSTPMNGNSVLSESRNRLGLTQNQAVESVVKVMVGNSSQYTVPYIAEKPGSVANDIYVENFVPHRQAQIALANYTLVKLVVPGDPSLVAGMTINFNLYAFEIVGNNRELDKFYSGKYLVNAVRHIIQSNGAYQTVLEIAKESYSTKPQSVNDNTDMKAAKNE